MKLGIMLGFEPSLAAVTTLARAAEDAGFDTVYTVEAGRSATITAAAVIAATERVGIGTYVVNAYAREPWMTGIEARDLNELCGGRPFALGVGTGNIRFNELYMGIDSSKPLAKMRDFVTIARAVLASQAGRPVRHQGDVHRIRWRASWSAGDLVPPVYLAASGPKMVALAGEVADGVAVGMMSSVEFVRDIVRPNARAASEAAGRNPDDLRFPMAAFVSLHRDAGRARELARAAICHLYHPIPHPYYDSQLRQLGFGEFADRARELVPAGRIREAMAEVPDAVIDEMTITGDPVTCAARIQQYEGIADEIIMSRLGPADESSDLRAYREFFELASAVRQ